MLAIAHPCPRHERPRRLTSPLPSAPRNHAMHPFKSLLLFSPSPFLPRNYLTFQKLTSPRVSPRRPYRPLSSLSMDSAQSPSAAQPPPPVGESPLVAALQAVRARVQAASAGRAAPAQLVAVSKTKPVALLRAAYDAGQRHFGENYVQELVQKSEEMPADVMWHFIGPLQSNKAKALVGVRGLHVVESVDREKTAKVLDRAVVVVGRGEKLNVMVQVNTSGEESKSGCEPGQAAQLCKVVVASENLVLTGLMTIGAPDVSDEPEAFKVLARERDEAAKALGWEPSQLRLSMGMSGDFENAIRMGSDSVRVGSTIFGAREYPNK